MKCFLEVFLGTVLLAGFCFSIVMFFLFAYGLIFDGLQKFLM